ncbi:class I adenylate-forming enzyme family protein [Micromonospora sp. NPDC050417]|uniref:class I adenylate-forming enzyme family protein n=1 Tax=Micromonospora sp. NPDC050417 TaxID=3364280 RepID=UPI0037AA8F2F
MRDAPGSPDEPALLTGARAWTRRQLLDEAERLAHHLAQQPSDGRILVGDVIDVGARTVLTLAADLAGLPLLHSDTESPTRHDGIIVSDSATRDGDGGQPWVGTGGFEFWTQVSGEPRNLAGVPGRSQIFLTSGSTGVPVGVVRPAERVLADGRRSAAFLGYRPGQTVVVSTLTFHSYGFTYGLISPLVHGLRVRHLSSRSVPSQVARAVHGTSARFMIGLPYQFRLLAATPTVAVTEGLATLHAAVSSGSALPVGVAAAVAHYPFTLYNAYGSSETGAISLRATDDDERPGAVGAPLPGIEAKLDADAGLGRGGELLLKTTSLAAGYLGPNGLAPLRTVDDRPGDQPWYRTGDLAELDADGIHLIGRVSSVINVAGKKVDPQEIHDVLVAHPRVREAHVAPADDEVRGQVPVARVVAAGPLTTAELLDWCQARLASHQMPRRISLVDNLPRSALGKVLRS